MIPAFVIYAIELVGGALAIRYGPPLISRAVPIIENYAPKLTLTGLLTWLASTKGYDVYKELKKKGVGHVVSSAVADAIEAYNSAVKKMARYFDTMIHVLSAEIVKLHERINHEVMERISSVEAKIESATAKARNKAIEAVYDLVPPLREIRDLLKYQVVGKLTAVVDWIQDIRVWLHRYLERQVLSLQQWRVDVSQWLHRVIERRLVRVEDRVLDIAKYIHKEIDVAIETFKAKMAYLMALAGAVAVFWDWFGYNPKGRNLRREDFDDVLDMLDETVLGPPFTWVWALIGPTVVKNFGEIVNISLWRWHRYD